MAKCDREFRARAAIFDLDGTLLDTLDDLADSMNETLSQMGFPTHPTHRYRYFIGDGVEELARRVLPEGRRDVEVVRLCAEKMVACYQGRWANKTRPYGGVMEVLHRLTEAGVPMAILSNKPQDFTSLTVTHFFGQVPFFAVVGASQERPKKPDPSSALEIASGFSIPPESIFFLGDSEVDIRTALAAGMFPAGATWGFRGGSELTDAGSMALLEKPADCLKFFALDGRRHGH